MSNNSAYPPPPPSHGDGGFSLGKSEPSEPGSTSGQGSSYPSAPQPYGASQGYYPSPSAGQYGGGAPVQQNDDKSILALILSIVSFFFLGLILSIPSLIISGNILKVNPHDGKAKAARIISWVNIGLCIVVALFWIIIMIAGIASGSGSSTY